MRYTSVDVRTEMPCEAPPAGIISDGIKFMFLPLIRCYDCPGKLYMPGPETTVGNFESHLRNREHGERVDERIATAAFRKPNENVLQANRVGDLQSIEMLKHWHNIYPRLTSAQKSSLLDCRMGSREFMAQAAIALKESADHLSRQRERDQAIAEVAMRRKSEQRSRHLARAKVHSDTALKLKADAVLRH